MNDPRRLPRTYDVGDRLEMEVEVLHPVTEEPFDPASLVIAVNDGGEVTKPPVTQVSKGVYLATHILESEGSGAWSADAFDEEGKSLGAEEVEFRVRERLVPR